MLEPGSQVGRYEIQRRLGRGGMGAVYVAHDPVLGRMVAIKVFSGELDFPEARERFSREARSVAALNHPNIVTVYDYGEYGSQPYIVMEYVPGETLAQMIRRKAPASLLDKVRWIEELCAGAGYAHQMSMIHRDIKPSNLIIDRSGRLKILDFGIARVMGTASNTTGVVGTPGYMAPEQILDGPIDHRADLFSIGVVSYELLAYAEAFPGDNMASITHRIVTAAPVPLAQIAPDAPPEVVAIVERLLRKVPSDRLGDAGSVRSAVSRIRRRLESDSHQLIAPTILRPPRVTPAGSTNRETPSAGRGPNERVAVAHPTPAPTRTPGVRKTDREALARRREEQVKAALDRARALLAQNDLEGAYEACQQALMFDDQHREGLELEETIQAAFAALDAAPAAGAGTYDVLPAVPGFDSDGNTSPPQRGGEQATGGDDGSVGGLPPVGPMQPKTVRDSSAVPSTSESAPQYQRDEQVSAAMAAVGGPIDRAILAPGAARGHKDSPRPSAAPLPVAGLSLKHRLLTNTEQLTANLLGSVRALGQAAAALLVSPRSPRQQKAMLVAVIAAVAVAAAIAALVTISVRPAPVGTLIIDAVPWGMITSIQSEDGERVTAPPQAATPLSLSLPPGNYEVVVTGPPPESRAQRLTVRIDSQAINVVPTVRFRVITPEEYFESYLAASSAAAQLPLEAMEPGNLPPVVPQPVLSLPTSLSATTGQRE